MINDFIAEINIFFSICGYIMMIDLIIIDRFRNIRLLKMILYVIEIQRIYFVFPALNRIFERF
jgi:hypothetical protein